MPFVIDKLDSLITQKKSAIVVGMDPRPDRFPPGMIDHGEKNPRRLAECFNSFARGIIEAVADSAVAIKFQSAFYERLGPAGLEALISSLAFARENGLLTILDVKRGDIGSTAEAYAEATLGNGEDTPGLFTDIVTVNPYLGEDSIKPFLEIAKRNGKGIFVLVKTSNPSGPRFQDLTDADRGRQVYKHVAEMVNELSGELKGECGLSGVGAVVGATYPEVIRELRGIMPESLFLLPGIGAQGGKISDLAPAFVNNGRGALLTASRSVIYAWNNYPGLSWKEAAQKEAEKLCCEFRDMLCME